MLGFISLNLWFYKRLETNRDFPERKCGNVWIVQGQNQAVTEVIVVPGPRGARGGGDRGRGVAGGDG